MLGYIVVASVLISIVSFVGVVVLATSQKLLNKILLLLVALSAGTLLGNVFFHLLPEAIEALPPSDAFLMVLVSFVLFFFVERVLHWHHCHKTDHSHHKTFGTMNLIGDAVHNFTDGLVIAATFVASIPLGIATSISIALHEIPQEIGDFGVLIHSGYSRSRALFLNFLVALGALAGALVGYFLVTSVPIIEAYLIPIAAGGFLYIGATDLLPELNSGRSTKKIIYSFLAFVVGVAIMYFLFTNSSHTHEDAEHSHLHEEEQSDADSQHLDEHEVEFHADEHETEEHEQLE